MLLFTDGIVVLIESGENLQRMIEELPREYKSRCGEEHEENKGITCSDQLAGQQILIGNKTLEKIEEYTYQE